MKIKFLPQGVEVEGSSNKTLLQIATENRLEIRSICKGVPSCAECRVRIAEGESNILPPTKAELNLIGTSHFIDGRRLSCQVRCFGDVTVDLTEQVERAEHQTKKIRGFRSQKQIESHAVNDTFLLTEKPEDRKAEGASEQQEGEGKQPEQKAQQPQQQRQQQKQQNQQKQHQQKQHQNQQKQQHERKQGQQQGGSGERKQHGQQQGQRQQGQQQQGGGRQQDDRKQEPKQDGKKS